jgi:hypothetical protein
MDTTEKELIDRMHEMQVGLIDRINGVERNLSDRINNAEKNLNAKIDANFYKTIGILIAVVGLAVTIIKLT